VIELSDSFETPEGVVLHRNIAGPVVRGYAFLVDIAIRSVIQAGIAIVLSLLGKIGGGLMLLSFFLLEWFYPLVFEVYRFGQTPGKKFMGIKVVQENGLPVKWLPSATRNLLRAIDFLPLMYIGGLISIILSGRFQRLGDLAAGTLVIYSSPKLAKLPIPQRSPKNAPVILTMEEQQAVIGFAERSTLLSKERVKELSNILRAVFHKEEEAAVEELFQIANGLVGEK